MRLRGSLLIAPLLVLAACRSVPTGTNAVVAADDVDNAWDYLSAKYDRDGDGRVVEAEYDRTGGEFEKLDRNEDGVLDASDYPRRESPGMGRDWDAIPAQRKKRMGDFYSARAVVLTYFQPDPDAEGLHRDQLVEMFDALDSDESDDIDESEFACATDPRPWGGPGKAWPLLVAALDETGDADGRLSRAEVLAYHEKLANDEGWARGAPARLTRSGDTALAGDGAPEGTRAPDFTLEPVGGGDPVTLSNFAGVRPVALIFGSYT